MTGPPDLTNLLRWYPRSWRERYGAELLVMVEDTLGGDRPSRRLRFSLGRSGLVERLQQAGLGRDLPAEQRGRTGALLVLCAWSLFIPAGIGLAKFAEHWQDVTSRASQGVPSAAITLVGILALVAVGLFGLAGVTAVPAIRGAVREGAWGACRRPVLRAGWSLLAMALASTGGIIWAHHLSNRQRNGGYLLYGAGAIVGIVIFVTTLVLCTAAVVAIERQLRPTARLVRAEIGVGMAVAVLMVMMTVASLVWWGSLASSAPWFFQGAPVGTASSPWAWKLAVAGGVMVVASTVGVAGVVRIGGAVRDGWGGSAR